MNRHGQIIRLIWGFNLTKRSYEMRKEFKFHKLNEEGQLKAQTLADIYNDLCKQVEKLVGQGSAELTISTRKLEESCFYAKKAMAELEENQEIS
jgi:hypothetical protein